ncbi:MAG TPA: hypothetical protein VG672_14310, partial [Bryobacteraceae bacterium]|nr:hypothetical protein [Bryobacteraceae bacterium]
GDIKGPVVTIVGVVEDIRPAALDRELPPQIYRPHRQWPHERMTIVLRTSQEPDALASAVRAEIRKMDRNLPIAAIRTMREIVSASVAERRFHLVLTSLFALAALALGAVGVYGVISHSVACRTRKSDCEWPWALRAGMCCADCYLELRRPIRFRWAAWVRFCSLRRASPAIFRRAVRRTWIPWPRCGMDNTAGLHGGS